MNDLSLKAYHIINHFLVLFALHYRMLHLYSPPHLYTPNKSMEKL